MMFPAIAKAIRFSILVFVTILCGIANGASPEPLALLERLDAYPYTKQVTFAKREVLDHEIGLGAIQKVRGEWRFKHSERLSGTLMSYTWQILDGYGSAQVMEDFLDAVTTDVGANLLFSCQGRACGQGVQWANRVFHEQVLYGREDLQRYRVYAIEGEQTYRLVVYSAKRTEDRQYLHVELLRIAE
jgi:Domain of unknown function (DUF4892)